MNAARGLVFGLVLVLAGCSSDFKPASEITGLRVLALKAEPPDLRPGESAALSTLVVDPSAPTRRNSVLYLACDPDPTDLAENPCVRYENLQDPSQALSAGDGGFALLPGARFLGIDAPVHYTAPADLFDALPADALSRKRGVLAVVLALAVGEQVPALPTQAELQALLQRIKSKELPSVLTLKRIRISEDPRPNHNPVLGFVTTDEEVLTSEHGLRLEPGAQTPLLATAASGADEAYVSLGPAGAADARVETAVVSWFTSAGSFNHERTVDTAREQTLLAPQGGESEPLPADGYFSLWVVVRDGRGGVDWQSLPGFICNPSNPAPAITSASVDPNGILIVSGAHLDQVLDANLGGVPLSGYFDPIGGVYSARTPPGVSGNFPLILRGKGCRDASATVQLGAH